MVWSGFVKVFLCYSLFKISFEVGEVVFKVSYFFLELFVFVFLYRVVQIFCLCYSFFYLQIYLDLSMILLFYYQLLVLDKLFLIVLESFVFILVAFYFLSFFSRQLALINDCGVSGGCGVVYRWVLVGWIFECQLLKYIFKRVVRSKFILRVFCFIWQMIVF